MQRMVLALFLWQLAAPAPAPSDIDIAPLPPPAELRVSVMQPPVRSVARGTHRVPVLHVHTSASCGAGPVELRGMRVRRTGLGSHTDIDAVYVERGGARVSAVRQVPRDGVIDLPLRGVTLASCSQAVFEVLADMSSEAEAAGEHRFMIASSSDIDAGGTSVTVDRAGDTGAFRTSGGLSAGTVRVEYARLGNPIRFGPSRIVGRLRFIANGRADQRIERVTLTNDGTASNDDLRNLFLETSQGVRLTHRAASLQNDRVTLVFDPPLALRRNDTRLLTLRADVHVGASKTVRFLVDEERDVVARPGSPSTIR